MRSAAWLLAALAARASASGCGDCWCVRNVSAGEQCPTWQPHNYSKEEIAAIAAPTPTNIWRLDGGCNPYKNASCTTIPPLAEKTPESVCGVRHAPGCGTYDLKDFASAAAAAAAGYSVTHNGPCGLCSTMKDLAMYINVEDMTSNGKRCGAESLLSIKLGVKCFEKLGMTPDCALIWAYDAISDALPCGLTCLKDTKQPYNVPPDCRLNDCLQCDEDKAGPVFKRFAARTRRDSGLISAIQRPCSTVARLVHQPCNASASQ
eukprot:TRINITY_DN1628_c10_g1_i1.p1 TRINITY_DN1628_c10_g1~~TRINITY_DN1628_c10_g1_i1.p1  ORF type:complete len:286 (+),score=97.89 TRINITY_DN1628_c10_g1_i1:74-859(+)